MTYQEVFIENRNSIVAARNNAILTVRERGRKEFIQLGICTVKSQSNLAISSMRWGF